jgi:threonine dehydratase
MIGTRDALGLKTKDALGLKTKIVGVVAEAANAYLQSFTAGRGVATNSALTFADGMAVRVPDPTALEVIRKGAERIVQVSDDEIAEAIRSIYSATQTAPRAPVPRRWQQGGGQPSS